MKTACVLRWGAYGDVLQVTPIYSALKKKGYHVTAHVNERGVDVIRNNPNIDTIKIHITDSIKHEDLEDYWNELAKEYDLFINLSGSVETLLLKPEGSKEFSWSKSLRHKKCNKNYSDQQFEMAGCEDYENKNAEMYYSQLERQLAKKERKKRDGFLILWALSGSAMHKSYPFTELIINKLLNRYDDIHILFVGDMVCQLLFDRNWFGVNKNRVVNSCGHWPIRKSLIMTEYCDLVIGPETGVLNAAGGLDVPKIIFLSHSTHENLSKYWRNVTPLWSNVVCYPCHQLHYTLESCTLDYKLGSPLCMAKLEPKVVYDEIEKQYLRWKDARCEKRSNGRRFKQTSYAKA